MSCNCTNCNTEGFGFNPDDKMLVSYFLRNKLLGIHSQVHPIAEIHDLKQWDPSELTLLTHIHGNEPVWYFFCQPRYKNMKKTFVDRTIKNGYWKITSEGREVKCSRTKQQIGVKKYLVLYHGCHSAGTKTNWIMHEYHYTAPDITEPNYVLCKLMKKD